MANPAATPASRAANAELVSISQLDFGASNTHPARLVRTKIHHQAGDQEAGDQSNTPGTDQAQGVNPGRDCGMLREGPQEQSEFHKSIVQLAGWGLVSVG